MEIKYAGFWIRIGASLIDSLVVSIIIFPILFYIYGVHYFFSAQLVKGLWDVLLQLVFPAIAIVILWIYRSATPGKEIADIIIVDADSLQPPSPKQCILRYLGYYISLFALGLGFFTIAFDKRRQGWHDKIANTLVIYKGKNN